MDGGAASRIGTRRILLHDGCIESPGGRVFAGPAPALRESAWRYLASSPYVAAPTCAGTCRSALLGGEHVRMLRPGPHDDQPHQLAAHVGELRASGWHGPPRHAGTSILHFVIVWTWMSSSSTRTWTSRSCSASCNRSDFVHLFSKVVPAPAITRSIAMQPWRRSRGASGSSSRLPLWLPRLTTRERQAPLRARIALSSCMLAYSVRRTLLRAVCRAVMLAPCAQAVGASQSPYWPRQR